MVLLYIVSEILNLIAMTSILDITLKPNPYLRYDIGLSYHSIVYMISSFGYLVFILVYAWHVRHSLEYSRVRIYPSFTYYLFTRFFEKLLSSVAIFGYEYLEPRYNIVANISMLLNNILLLWNTAFYYMILMMISVGFN